MSNLKQTVQEKLAAKIAAKRAERNATTSTVTATTPAPSAPALETYDALAREVKEKAEKAATKKGLKLVHSVPNTAPAASAAAPAPTFKDNVESLKAQITLLEGEKEVLAEALRTSAAAADAAEALRAEVTTLQNALRAAAHFQNVDKALGKLAGYQGILSYEFSGESAGKRAAAAVQVLQKVQAKYVVEGEFVYVYPEFLGHAKRPAAPKA